MNRESQDLWERALESLEAAQVVLKVSPDAAASRAYYAAFFAVSALFSEWGRTYKKHSGIEAAVHRDLVHNGDWPASRGADYSRLFELRQTGDYGISQHVTQHDAEKAIEAAKDIIQAIADKHSDQFQLPN